MLCHLLLTAIAVQGNCDRAGRRVAIEGWERPTVANRLKQDLKLNAECVDNSDGHIFELKVGSVLELR